MGQYELTNEQFLEFLNDASVSSEGIHNEHLVITIKSEYCPFAFKDDKFQLKDIGKDNFPVIEVTWWGAIEYCNWLSDKHNLSKAYDGKDTDSQQKQNGNMQREVLKTIITLPVITSLPVAIISMKLDGIQITLRMILSKFQKVSWLFMQLV